MKPEGMLIRLRAQPDAREERLVALLVGRPTRGSAIVVAPEGKGTIRYNFYGD